MLIDHTHRDRRINSAYLEKAELIQQLQKKLNPRSFNKLVRIIDEAIGNVAGTDQTLCLPWACAGSLFGGSSQLPHGDVNYVWDRIIEIVGPDKFCKMAVGALLQWRIALRAETEGENWHAFRREYEEIDPDTNKPISRYEYWMS